MTVAPHTPFPDPIHSPAFQTRSLQLEPHCQLVIFLPVSLRKQRQKRKSLSSWHQTCPCPCISALILYFPLNREEPSSSVYPGQLATEAGIPSLLPFQGQGMAPSVLARLIWLPCFKNLPVPILLMLSSPSCVLWIYSVLFLYDIHILVGKCPWS